MIKLIEHFFVLTTSCFLYVTSLVSEAFAKNDRLQAACLTEIKKSKIALKAWRTLLVYTSVTPCLMYDSRSRKGTVFVPKHGKKTCKGTD